VDTNTYGRLDKTGDFVIIKPSQEVMSVNNDTLRISDSISHRGSGFHLRLYYRRAGGSRIGDFSMKPTTTAKAQNRTFTFTLPYALIALF
jgi:hypothetical protein